MDLPLQSVAEIKDAEHYLPLNRLFASHLPAADAIKIRACTGCPACCVAVRLLPHEGVVDDCLGEAEGALAGRLAAPDRWHRPGGDKGTSDDGFMQVRAPRSGCERSQFGGRLWR